MKKYLYLFSSIAVLGLYSCKEQAVGVTTNEATTDSTYVLSTPESAQTKYYYVEEFTGVRCPNCPSGALQLESMNENNNSLLIINSIHAGSLTSPEEGVSTQDFRTTDGTNLLNGIYGGDVNKPCASFDRLPLGTSGVLFGYSNQWNGMLANDIASYSSVPVNITITPTKSDDEYYVKIKLSFVTEMDSSLSLSVFLNEDNIRDAQIDPLLPDTVYNNVFRKALSAPTGDIILDSLSKKVAGRVLETTYKFSISSTDSSQKYWAPANMHVIAIVHDPASKSSKRIYQAAKVNLQ